MVIKINQGGCDPSCCGEPMKELRANDTDGAKEKHVPAVAIVDRSVLLLILCSKSTLSDLSLLRRKRESRSNISIPERNLLLSLRYLMTSRSPYTSTATFTASGKRTSLNKDPHQTCPAGAG